MYSIEKIVLDGKKPKDMHNSIPNNFRIVYITSPNLKKM